MTVESTTNRVDYTGNGSLTTYAYPFMIFDEENLYVYVAGELKVLNTEYTVTEVGNPAGGDVIFTTAPANGAAIAIIRIMEKTQLVDYVAHDSFPAETHEQALDRLTMMIQEGEEALGRCVKLPVTSTLEDIELPVSANRFIHWNDDASQLECVEFIPEQGSLELPVKISDGGTGATTAPVARTNLGVPDLNHKTRHQDGGADEINVAGLLGLLADSQNPLGHKTSHKSGGSDAIQIDEFTTPSDNTDCNVSNSAHGLCPKLPNDSAKFLNGQGAWTPPSAGALSYEEATLANDVNLASSGTWYDGPSKNIGAGTWLVIAKVTCLVNGGGSNDGAVHAQLLQGATVKSYGMYCVPMSGIFPGTITLVAIMVLTGSTTVKIQAQRDMYTSSGNIEGDTSYTKASNLCAVKIG